jgi:hypothetical protein
VRIDVESEVKAKVSLTLRDKELFRLLVRARWLSSSQVAKGFFPDVSMNAVQKRLRRLVDGDFLRSVRLSRTEENYVALARLGREATQSDVHLERRLPSQIEHFSYVNDVRLWIAALDIPPTSFFAEWEYRPFATQDAVVPDAVVTVGAGEQRWRLAVEIDCSTENASVLANKVQRYVDTVDQIAGVLIWAPGLRRIKAIASACLRADVVQESLPLYLADLDGLRNVSADSRAMLNFVALSRGETEVMQSLRDILASPLDPSCRKERRHFPSPSETDSYEQSTDAIYTRVER